MKKSYVQEATLNIKVDMDLAFMGRLIRRYENDEGKVLDNLGWVEKEDLANLKNAKRDAISEAAQAFERLTREETQGGEGRKPLYFFMETKEQTLGNKLKFKLEFMMMMLMSDRREQAARVYDQLIEEFDKLK